MTTFRKKILSILVGFAMAVCLCFGISFSAPVTASAVTLDAVYSGGGTVDITQDILQTTSIEIAEGADVEFLAVNYDETIKRGYDYPTDKALIEVYGNLTLNSVTLDGNCGVKIANGVWSATDKAGTQPLIRVHDGATVTMIDCYVMNNYSKNSGAGIVVEEGGTLIFNGGSVSSCVSAQNGGGILNKGTLEFKKGNVQLNYASGAGGGIYAEGADVRLNSFPMIKNNASGVSATDSVHLAKNATGTDARFVITGALTKTNTTMPIGVTSSVVSAGSSNTDDAYLTYGWNESWNVADFFTPASDRLAIGEELLNGELVGYYCGTITYHPGNGAGESYVEYYSTENNFYELTASDSFHYTGYSQSAWQVTWYANSQQYSQTYNVGNASINTTGGFDYTAVAQWQINTYTLTYDYKDGSDARTMRVQYMKTASLPLLTITGYTLEGWSLDPNATEAELSYAGFNYSFEEDVTVYAVWSLDGTRLTLDGNGGTDETADAIFNNKNFGAMDRLTLPTREGYRFLGYTVTKDGEDYVVDANGQVCTNVEGYTNANGWGYAGETLTLYASWELESYRFVLNSDGGTSFTAQTRTYGEAYNLPAPTKTGSTFLGWYTADGKLVSGNVADHGENGASITLSASWMESRLVSLSIVGSVKSAYYLDEAFETNGATLTATYDNGDELTGIAITEEMLSGFSTASVAENATATITYEGVTASFTYSVSQMPIDVTFDVNGGMGLVPVLSGVKGGDTLALPTEELTKTGYTFVGWNASSDGQTYAAGATFTFPNEDVVFTAAWRLKAPTVSAVNFDGNAVSAENGRYTIAFTYDGIAHSLQIGGAHELDVTFTYGWYKLSEDGTPIPPWLSESEYQNYCTYLGEGSELFLQNVAEGGYYYGAVRATDGALTSNTRVDIFVSVDKAGADITATETELTYTDGLELDLADYITVAGGGAWSATVTQNGVAFDYADKQITNITKAGGSFTVTVTAEESENYLAGTQEFTFTLNKGAQNLSIVQPSNAYRVFNTYKFELDGFKTSYTFGVRDLGTGMQATMISDGTFTVTHLGTGNCKVTVVAAAVGTDLYEKAETSITIVIKQARYEGDMLPPLPENVVVCLNTRFDLCPLPDGWKIALLGGANAFGGSPGLRTNVRILCKPEDTINYMYSDEFYISVMAEEHTGGEATCANKAVCERCNSEYGELLEHTWVDATCTEAEHCTGCLEERAPALGHTLDDEYAWINADANKHYHVCIRCAAKDEGEAHIPNIDAATEESAKYCTVCNFVMEEQLAHTHVFDEIVDEAYKVSDATCTESAVYHKSCVCKEASEETFVYGDPLGHTEGAEATCTTAQICTACGEELMPALGHTLDDEYAWINADANKHYHVCIRCDAKDEGEAHTPNIDAATEESAKYCTVCNFVMEEQLAHTHVFDEIVDEAYKVSDATCTESAVYHKSCACKEASEETFVYGDPLGHTEGAEATCTTAQICMECGEELNAALGHSYGEEYSAENADEDRHYHVCARCDAKDEGEEHTPNIDAATEESAKYCTVCKYVIEEQLVPALHTHYVCGVSCAHNGAAHDAMISYLPLTQTALASIMQYDAAGNPLYYEITTGSWYLAEDIVVDNEITITNNVDLCLNGYTMSFASETSVCHFDDTLNICDCSESATGKMSFNTSGLGILIGDSETEQPWEPVLNIYGGLIENAHTLGGGIRVHNGDVNVYGGTVKGRNDFAMEVFGASEINVYDGLINSVSHVGIGLYAIGDYAPTLNIYGGTISGPNGYGVIASSGADVQMSGGYVSGLIAGMYVNLGSSATFTGGELYASGTATSARKDAAGLRVEGASQVTVYKLTVTGKQNAICTGIEANVFIDPVKDEDVIVESPVTCLYMTDGRVDSDGKVVINGGTFTNTSKSTGSGLYAIYMDSGNLEVNGGVFTTKNTSYLIVAELTATAEMTLKLSGAPKLDQNDTIRLWKAGVNDEGEYRCDFSGYTGGVVNLVFVKTYVEYKNGLIVAKGDASKFNYTASGWTLTNGSDENGNAVMQLVCAQHKGGEPTCTTAATCTNCGDAYMLSHSFGELLPEVPATCAATGVKAHMDCELCGKHFNESGEELLDLTIAIDENAHSLNQKEGKAATCTEIGWDAYEACENCDYSTYVEIVALGHTAGTAATCTTAQTCTVCKEELTPALGHAAGAAATCTTAQTCTVCKEELTPALGHTAGAAATCTTAQICTVCKEELAPAKGHTAGAAATCTTAQTCTVCKTELAPAKGHTAGAAATCTTAQLCTECNAELAPAKGHTAGEAATCTTAQTCTVCKEELAPALGHAAGVAATCTTAQLCTECNAELAPALGHTESGWIVDTPAAEGVAGKQHKECTVCGERLSEEEIPALPVTKKGCFSSAFENGVAYALILCVSAVVFVTAKARKRVE